MCISDNARRKTSLTQAISVRGNGNPLGRQIGASKLSTCLMVTVRADSFHLNKFRGRIACNGDAGGHRDNQEEERMREREWLIVCRMEICQVINFILSPI